MLFCFTLLTFSYCVYSVDNNKNKKNLNEGCDTSNLDSNLQHPHMMRIAGR
jgi:hypothetical protein